MYTSTRACNSICEGLAESQACSRLPQLGGCLDRDLTLGGNARTNLTELYRCLLGLYHNAAQTHTVVNIHGLLLLVCRSIMCHGGTNK